MDPRHLAAIAAPRPKPPANPACLAQSLRQTRAAIFAGAAACCTAVLGIGAAVLPWRAIAPIARPDRIGVFRGHHRARRGSWLRSAIARSAIPRNGAVNAGGRPIETPFGTIYSTNITPDAETGIGAWSYPAFERAMREGIHRDGRHLYPAFPYTHFARTTDADLQALYAYLMAQTARARRMPEQSLAVSVQPASPDGRLECDVSSARRHSKPTRRKSDSLESRRISRRRSRPLRRLPFATQCARRGESGRLSRRRLCGRLGGATADVAVAGADPLERRRAVRLFADGRIPSSRRGGGPMAPVVKELASLPDSDIRAMAIYLASFNEKATGKPSAWALAAKLETDNQGGRGLSPGARHLPRGLRGLSPGRRPAAVRQPAIAGIEQQLAQRHAGQSDPGDFARDRVSLPSSDLGYMPGLQGQHVDDQVIELVSYLRRQFAPDKPAWVDLRTSVSRVTQETSH